MAQPVGNGARVSSLRSPPMRGLFLLQTALLGGGAIALLPWGTAAALSALLGGGIALLGNAWFARQVFRYRGARQARRIAHGFYRGEAGKFVLSAALLAALLAGWPAAKAPVVLLAFAGMHLAHTCCAAWMLGKKRIV